MATSKVGLAVKALAPDPRATGFGGDLVEPPLTAGLLVSAGAAFTGVEDFCGDSSASMRRKDSAATILDMERLLGVDDLTGVTRRLERASRSLACFSFETETRGDGISDLEGGVVVRRLLSLVGFRLKSKEGGN